MRRKTEFDKLTAELAAEKKKKKTVTISDSRQSTPNTEEEEEEVIEMEKLTKEMERWQQETGRFIDLKIWNKSKKSKLKVKQPESCDGKDSKWKDQITFDDWTEKISRWIKWEGLKLGGEEAFSLLEFVLEGNAKVWYNHYLSRYGKENLQESFYDYILFLRRKLIPTNYNKILWQKYKKCRQTMDGHTMSVNDYTRELE